MSCIFLIFLFLLFLKKHCFPVITFKKNPVKLVLKLKFCSRQTFFRGGRYCIVTVKYDLVLVVFFSLLEIAKNHSTLLQLLVHI